MTLQVVVNWRLQTLKWSIVVVRSLRPRFVNMFLQVVSNKPSLISHIIILYEAYCPLRTAYSTTGLPDDWLGYWYWNLYKIIISKGALLSDDTRGNDGNYQQQIFGSQYGTSSASAVTSFLQSNYGSLSEYRANCYPMQYISSSHVRITVIPPCFFDLPHSHSWWKPGVTVKVSFTSPVSVKIVK